MQRVTTILVLLSLAVLPAGAEGVRAVISKAMAGLDMRSSNQPYSRTIERMYIGYDNEDRPRIGIALREIESFKPITGMVIVEKTASGFVLREARFPDIHKIRNAKDRKQVASILDAFQNVPFDPHAEKSAVDGLTGATRYGIKTCGYLNYMARRTALEMESDPDWPKQKD
jgi:hypothetical protein